MVSLIRILITVATSGRHMAMNHSKIHQRLMHVSPRASCSLLSSAQSQLVTFSLLCLREQVGGFGLQVTSCCTSCFCHKIVHHLCSLSPFIMITHVFCESGNSDTEIAQLAQNIMVRSLEIQNALLLFFLRWEGQGLSKTSLKLNNTLNNHSPLSTDQLLINLIPHSVTLNLCLLIISNKSYMAQFKLGTMKLNMMFLWFICTIAYVRISLPFKTKYYFTKETQRYRNIEIQHITQISLAHGASYSYYFHMPIVWMENYQCLFINLGSFRQILTVVELQGML